MVLLVVLVVIVLLTLAAMTFSQLMLTEREGVEVAGSQSQAREAANSGIEQARAFLMQTSEVQQEASGWYDNPTQFRGAMVIDSADPRRRARFTLVAPKQENGVAMGIRYGLEDESGRLNLNAILAADKLQSGAGRTMLMKLPGMTEQTADAILDWLDADDTPREQGAETEYYSALGSPYACKNGPLDTIEELLLVRGVTPDLLFGADANRNGMADAGEPSPDASGAADTAEGTMTGGWAEDLTLYSIETNLKSDGTPKIDVNQSDLKKLQKSLQDALNQDWATFIIAFRQNGPYTGDKPGQTSPAGTLDYTQAAKTKLTTILDLVGQKTQVKFEGQKDLVVLECPFSSQPGQMGSYLPKLVENLTTNSLAVVPGRVNINQASKLVLTAIPGMTDEIADQIITRRPQDPNQTDSLHQNETWLLTDGIVTLEQMKKLLPFICTKGAVYRTQAVGFFDGGGPAARIEAVLDTTAQPARVLVWRDITNLGRGYPLETLGTEIY